MVVWMCKCKTALNNWGSWGWCGKDEEKKMDENRHAGFGRDVTQPIFGEEPGLDFICDPRKNAVAPDAGRAKGPRGLPSTGELI